MQPSLLHLLSARKSGMGRCRGRVTRDCGVCGSPAFQPGHQRGPGRSQRCGGPDAVAAGIGPGGARGYGGSGTARVTVQIDLTGGDNELLTWRTRPGRVRRARVRREPARRARRVWRTSAAGRSLASPVVQLGAQVLCGAAARHGTPELTELISAFARTTTSPQRWRVHELTVKWSAPRALARTLVEDVAAGSPAPASDASPRMLAVRSVADRWRQRATASSAAPRTRRPAQGSAGRRPFPMRARSRCTENRSVSM
jgi:hypothetical protein